MSLASGMLAWKAQKLGKERTKEVEKAAGGGAAEARRRRRRRRCWRGEAVGQTDGAADGAGEEAAGVESVRLARNEEVSGGEHGEGAADEAVGEGASGRSKRLAAKLTTETEGQVAGKSDLANEAGENGDGTDAALNRIFG